MLKRFFDCFASAGYRGIWNAPGTAGITHINLSLFICFLQ